MMTDGTRIETWIDAAEENAELRSDHIPNRASRGGEDLGPTGA